MSSYTGSQSSLQQMRVARAKLNAYRSFDIEEDLEFCPIASPSSPQLTNYDSAFLSKILATISTQQQNQISPQVASSYDYDDKKMNQSRRSYLMQLQQQQQQQDRKQQSQSQYSQYSDHQHQSHQLQSFQQQLSKLNYGSHSPSSTSSIAATLNNGLKNYQNQQYKYANGSTFSPQSQTASPSPQYSGSSNVGTKVNNEAKVERW